MSQLLVRDLDPAVKERLRKRAAGHGRSMAEEVRAILRAAVAGDAVAPRDGLGTRISRRFAGLGLVEEDVPTLRGEAARPAEFGG